jgi:Fe-S-cluster formation regulator IscX/YfhJ
MRRRTFLLTVGAASAGASGLARAADAQQQVFDLFSKIASALSDDDPAMFVEAVDPAMPNFQDFRRDVVALTDLADLTNSIEVLSDTGDDTHRAEELDWFLEIVGKSDSHTVEHRREVVKFRLERKGGKGKKWKIVSIDPLHFFAPPKLT